MKAHALKPHLPHELDNASAQTVGRIVCAARLAENQIVIVVVCSEQLAIVLLLLSVPTQDLERPLGDGETPRLF
jgi:hypothetical protein